MSGMTTANSSLLIRAELWSNELKEVLQDNLMSMSFVDMLVDFPDGNTFTIPSVGESQVDDYQEDTAVQYRPLDTGEWQFTIDEYLSSGTYVTRKNEQDSFYMSQLVSQFVPKQQRAILEHYEKTTFMKPQDVLGRANEDYVINGGKHRFAGGNAGRIEVADFAYAQYVLKQANVPQTNLIAIVDPSVEYNMNTLTNIANVSDNARWEGIVADGIATGMKFMRNIYGFDVYTSNYLDDVVGGAVPERASGTVDYSTTAGKACLFFSADSTILPWKSAWRQAPTVDTEWNKDFQRTEFVTTARYGTKLYRPENMIVVANTPTIAA